MKDLYSFRDWYRNNAALVYIASLSQAPKKFDPEIETKAIIDAGYVFDQVFGPKSFPEGGYPWVPATPGDSKEGVFGDFAGTIFGNDDYGFEEGFSWVENVFPDEGPPQGSPGGGVGKTSMGDVILAWAGKILAGAGVAVAATVSAPVAVIAGAAYVVSTYSAAKTTAEYIDENKNEKQEGGKDNNFLEDEGGKNFIYEVNKWVQKKRSEDLWDLIKAGVELNIDQSRDNLRERRLLSMLEIRKLNLTGFFGEELKGLDQDDPSGSEYRYRVNLYGDGSIYHDYKMWLLWYRGAPIDPMPLMTITRHEA